MEVTHLNTALYSMPASAGAPPTLFLQADPEASEEVDRLQIDKDGLEVITVTHNVNAVAAVESSEEEEEEEDE
eukprot:CAMPEP_0182439248 /NCGR_PEP_ID=MMETSP1167-20130531/86320_1 /TAXON_ID=2988 /ORGANISM="Mallomonas Sp, Strain CCMP3275" /LENGTH=72 /DNA_ID=CAMNT_0024632903 /DNA_START=623 /DNA_END=841 /DNA_ORIENTATION=-